MRREHHVFYRKHRKKQEGYRRKKVVLFCVCASYGRVEEIGEGEGRLKKRKLNYRFHNANEPELFLKLLLEVLIEANRKKVEDAIREYSDKQEREETRAEMCI